MKLSDFLKLNNPIEYNFEFENKLLAESGLDTYSRYFTYKANNDKARNSGYENGKKFAEGLAAGGNAEFYIAVPSDITEVEKRAFFDLIASSSLKTKKIRIVEKPIADALGAGLDVMDATGRLIVNIGADTTEISLISLGGIVQSRLLKIGGTKFDEAIQQTVKKKHNLVIGMKSAERLKMQLASGIKEEEEITYDVMGRNLITGLPNRVTVTNHLIFEAEIGRAHV